MRRDLGGRARAEVAGEELDDFRPWAWIGLGLLGAFALLGFFLRVTPW